ncbi:hypothetical protein K1X84_15040 [bacterium]|nr:hypothetical protein [bacterium]
MNEEISKTELIQHAKAIQSIAKAMMQQSPDHYNEHTAFKISVIADSILQLARAIHTQAESVEMD